MYLFTDDEDAQSSEPEGKMRQKDSCGEISEMRGLFGAVRARRSALRPDCRAIIMISLGTF